MPADDLVLHLIDVPAPPMTHACGWPRPASDGCASSSDEPECMMLCCSCKKVFSKRSNPCRWALYGYTSSCWPLLGSFGKLWCQSCPFLTSDGGFNSSCIEVPAKQTLQFRKRRNQTSLQVWDFKTLTSMLSTAACYLQCYVTDILFIVCFLGFANHASTTMNVRSTVKCSHFLFFCSQKVKCACLLVFMDVASSDDLWINDVLVSITDEHFWWIVLFGRTACACIL